MTRTGANTRGNATMWAIGHLVVGLLVAVVHVGRGPAAFDPSLAVGVGLLLTCGLQRWPLVVAVCTIVAGAQHGWALPDLVAGATASITIVVGTAALLLRSGFRWGLERLDDVALLGGVSALVAALGALVGTSLAAWQDIATLRFGDLWWVWFVGALNGLCLTLPLLHLLADPGNLRQRVAATGLPRLVEMVVVVFALAAGIVAFAWIVPPQEIGVQDAGVLLLGLLPSMWVALRFGVAITAIAVAAINVIAAVAYGVPGPHGPASDLVPLPHLASAELAILGVGLAALGVAAAVEAQQRGRMREEAVKDASPLGIITLDRNGRVLGWNAAAEQIFGWTAAEVVGRALPTVPPEHHAAFVSAVRGDGSLPREFTSTHLRRDGSSVVARVVHAPLRDVSGAPDGLVAIVEDVEDRMRRERQLQLLSTAIDQAGEAIVVTDAESHIIYANPAAERTSGYSREDMIGSVPHLLEGGSASVAEIEATLTEGRMWMGTTVGRRRDGQLYEEETSITPVVGESGTVVAYVAIKADLSRQRRLEDALRRSRDESEIVAQVMASVRSVDTDRAAATDLCQRIVAVAGFDAAAIARLRPDGGVLPLGVEGVSLPMFRIGVPTDGAWIRRFVAMTAQSPWWLDWTAPPALVEVPAPAVAHGGIVASAQVPIRDGDQMIGVLVVGSRDSDAVTWMGHRLSMVAELGAFAGTLLRGLPDATADELVTDRLDRLIEGSLFEIAYQPVIELETGRTWGYEALSRFGDGQRPDVVFADAWRLGRGQALELACVRAAIAGAARLDDGVCLTLNMSPQVVLDGGLHDVVDPRHPLVVEVTEHAPINDYEHLRRVFDGRPEVKVAVDDAGAGYASLRHILELQPDVVKVDIGIVRGIDDDPARQAIVAGLVHYAQTAGIALVGEGVETEAEMAMLRHLGVRFAQGYLLGRPGPLP